MNIIKHVFSFIPSPTSFAAYYEKRIHNANTTFRCMSIARICMSTEFMLVCVLPSLTGISLMIQSLILFNLDWGGRAAGRACCARAGAIAGCAGANGALPPLRGLV